MELRIDKPTIKALSNDKRVEILKKLKDRNFTQSELSGLLGLSVPSVKEHLDSLRRSGLVQRVDDGRKWKYYSLTKKAKNILQPEQVNLFIVLSTAVLSAVGVVYSLVKSSPVRKVVGADASLMAESVDVASARVASVGVAPGVQSGFFVVFFTLLLCLSIVSFFYFWIRRVRFKKKYGVL